MKDAFDARKCFADSDGITDIPLNEIDPIGHLLKICSLPRLQVVEDAYLVPRLKKAANNMGANKSGSTGY